MKGYIKQIIGETVEELYWFPVDIEEEIITIAYHNFQKLPLGDDDYHAFEEYWNSRNNDVKIERIFIEEIWL